MRCMDCRVLANRTSGGTVTAVNTYKVLLSLAVLTLTVSLPGFATNACAADPTVSSKWVGVYEGLSRGCSGQPLEMYASKFSWVDCKDANIRVIAMSDSELMFEVDAKARCGAAGLVVTLTRLSGGPAVDVHTYRSLEAYRAKEYGLFCVYSKKIVD